MWRDWTPPAAVLDPAGEGLEVQLRFRYRMIPIQCRLWQTYVPPPSCPPSTVLTTCPVLIHPTVSQQSPPWTRRTLACAVLRQIRSLLFGIRRGSGV